MKKNNPPFLVVMTSKPSERMEAWFWKVVQDECKIPKIDTKIVYLLDSPPKGAGGKPTVEQLRDNFDRFRQEILESECQICMPMGGPALYYLTGVKQSIDDARGYVLSSKFFRSFEWKVQAEIAKYKTNNKTKGIKIGDPRYGLVTQNIPGLLGSDFRGVVIPTFTLDYIRVSGFTVKPAFKEDVRRAARALVGSLKMIDKDLVFYTDFRTVQNEDGVKAGAPNLAKTKWIGGVVAVDIETHGFDNEVIDRVSVSDGYTTASIPWNLDAKNFLNDLFDRKDLIFALHNSPFDLPRLRGNGVRITDEVLDHQTFDTMFAAVTLQPDLYKRLGSVVTIYLDCEPWKWKILSESKPEFYSAKDAFMTAWLAHQEIRVMKTLGLWDLFMGVNGYPGPGIMATLPVLTEMSRTGIKTNRKYAEWWVGKLKKRLLKLEKLWSKQFGEINPFSTKQLQTLLYKDWGLPVQKKKTAEAPVSTDELALVNLKFYIKSDVAMLHDNNVWKNDKRCNERTFDLLLRLRDCAKTISTYVQPVALNEETRVHPSYLPVAKDDENVRGYASKGNTSTGRLATSRPNIANQPDKTRVLYVPDDPNSCFIEFDWKAAELRTFAYLANDKRLIEDLQYDLHQRNADRFGITRDTAKNIIFASQYLAGAAKVNEMILAQEHMYIPVEECKRIMNGLKQYYSDVTAFKNYLIQLCETQHYIKNPFGRIRYFHNNESPAAVDFVAQSVVADLMWCSLKPMSDLAKSLNGRVVTTVYDSVLVQSPSENLKEMIKKGRQVMETKYTQVAPNFYLPCEIKVGMPGQSWKEVKKYNE